MGDGRWEWQAEPYSPARSPVWYHGISDELFFLMLKLLLGVLGLRSAYMNEADCFQIEVAKGSRRAVAHTIVTVHRHVVVQATG